MEPEQVMQLVKQNDNDSRRVLFETFYKHTFAVVYNILRSRENTEDITQDAFIKAFQNLRQLKDGAKFGAWLTVIASNLARNYLKREKKIVLTDDQFILDAESVFDDTEAEAMRNFEIERVRKAIRTLPPDQYQIIVLQYYYDLKVGEIAEMLKIRQGTVKSRLFRARQRLTAALEPEGGPDCLFNGGGDQG
ncbi:MAG TPA: RNA polymerase sigma factor [Candidatus Limnocylindrales bacterium]|nr:RNA polymerase sigma factor [Candidatus Limnocylindrales bacterium]